MVSPLEGSGFHWRLVTCPYCLWLGALISSASVCKDQRGTTFCDQHRMTGSQGGFSYILTCYHPCGRSEGLLCPHNVVYPGENWSPAVHLEVCTLCTDSQEGSPGFPRLLAFLDSRIFWRAGEGLLYPALPETHFLTNHHWPFSVWHMV